MNGELKENTAKLYGWLKDQTQVQEGKEVVNIISFLIFAYENIPFSYNAYIKPENETKIVRYPENNKINDGKLSYNE